jgi:hypothetical protein
MGIEEEDEDEVEEVDEFSPVTGKGETVELQAAPLERLESVEEADASRLNSVVIEKEV